MKIRHEADVVLHKEAENTMYGKCGHTGNFKENYEKMTLRNFWYTQCGKIA